jgi:hypothetical protein
MRSNEFDPDPIILKPRKFAGIRYHEFLNKYVNWTEELKEDLQTELRYGNHRSMCGIPKNGNSEVLPEDLEKYHDYLGSNEDMFVMDLVTYPKILNNSTQFYSACSHEHDKSAILGTIAMK